MKKQPPSEAAEPGRLFRRRWYSLLALAVLLLAVGYILIIQAWKNKADILIGNFVRNHPFVQRLSYGDIAVNLLGTQFRLRNVEFQLAGCDTPIFIQNTELGFNKKLMEDTIRFRCRVEDARVTPGALPAENRRVLSDLGCEKLDFTVFSEGLIDFQERRLRIDNAYLNLLEMGEFRLAGQLGGIDMHRFQKSPLFSIFSPDLFAGISLHRLQLIYHDQSLMKRLLHYGARRVGYSDRRFYHALVTGIQSAADDARSKEFQQLLSGLLAFLETSGPVQISFTPQTPARLMQLILVADLEQLCERLGVRIEPVSGSAVISGSGPAAQRSVWG